MSIVLLFFSMVLLLVLMCYVFYRNPKGRVNRLLSIYLFNLAASVFVSQVMSTIPDPNIAGYAAIVLFITNYALNSFFLPSVVLAMFHPSFLLRWYGLPLLLSIAILFSIGLLSDGLFGTEIFYIPHSELGHGYIPSENLLIGSGGWLLRMWLFVGTGASIVLLVGAWIRAPRDERRPITLLIVSLFVIGGMSPFLPDDPLAPAVPAVIFSVTFAFIVGNQGIFLLDQVALKAVFHSASEGMVICNREWQNEQINLAAERMMGISGTEVIGRSFVEAFDSFLQRTRQVEGERSLVEAIAASDGESFVTRLHLDDPESCVLSVASVHIRDKQGRVLGNLLTFRDVTEGMRVSQLLVVEQEQHERLQEIMDSLQSVITQVREAARDLNSTASEILTVTMQQASGASEQSAAIAQTTTTVDELKTIAEQSVSRAQEVAGTSQRTVEISRAGRQAVSETIGSMEQIKVRVEEIAENILALSGQTQQIGEIITTVNDIAAQSNILALNASVEAARAGEYGKGFAVVAVEVRNLAEQSRQATAQVKAILSDIQKATNTTVMATEEGTKQVEEGAQLAIKTGEAIEQLAGVIEESAQAATQMVAGGRQQSSGVEQVALAMQNINQATGQSLASTRQAEKAAQGLSELARNLIEIVEQYQS
ncbi:MAG: PAS domain-containing protein [Chloroflexi bacterium]|nr:PAS domain-containing protein [Chloroflexota bacterium]